MATKSRKQSGTFQITISRELFEKLSKQDRLVIHGPAGSTPGIPVDFRALATLNPKLLEQHGLQLMLVPAENT